jgi:hypothetical protein
MWSGVVAAQPRTAHRIPRQTQLATGAIEGLFQNDQKLGLGNVQVTLRNLSSNQAMMARTSGDGIFRVLNVVPGRYSLRAVLDGYRTVDRNDLEVLAGELVNLEITLVSTNPTLRKQIPDADPGVSYRKLITPQDNTIEGAPTGVIPPEGNVFSRVPNRWQLDFPDYQRYGPRDDFPFIDKHDTLYFPGKLIDPFNRNKLKGDYPIIGNQVFLNLNLTSDTFVDSRRLPTPSLVGSVNPGSQEFFGNFQQFVLVQNFGFSMSLFHGDAAFRPIDWQIKVTPELNINYVKVGENGIISPDVRNGTTRLDAHAGLQEGFFEVKLKDLSHNFDFVSVRAGVQTFNSDFRGFIFLDQEPGLRIFGNLRNNKYQYNAAYFSMLEKDSNSGLNRFKYRQQQVFIANLYRQDFFRPGFTIQGSYHYNKDDAGSQLQFDTNGFLVRPAPIGNYNLHTIRAHYIGLTSDGHIGRLNINQAFYQVLGHDSANPIVGIFPRSDPRNFQTIIAQMAALELSLDRDWIRYRISGFYSSGDSKPRDGVARGFDPIFDNPNFNGGFFSFWNREGIRLLGTGVGLVQGNSIVPSLRSSKIEGQSNFINPGLVEYNASSDIDITPKLKGVLNFNYITFVHTESMQELLFQKTVHKGVGADSGVGFVYRPPLSDNIVITAVFNMFNPFRGFRDILANQTLYSVAANVRFRF